jgi:tetratricopeptide (TPR) repeat protein
MVVEVMPAVHGGAAVSELLREAGDAEGAAEALALAARAEQYAPLAAQLYRRLGSLLHNAAERLHALDEAVARCPALAAVRWERLRARLALGNVKLVLADAEQLEASAQGAQVRHETCEQVARVLLDEGFARDAAKWFERALRYAPDDAASTAGLARAFVATGRPERAVSLLRRALVLSERAGSADAALTLELGELIAAHLRDLPQAVARVRQVAADAPQASRARYLEARWRAALGDLAGASLAYARMRELCELGREHAPALADQLLEAARFEQETQDDVIAAERHLAAALRAAPGRSDVGQAYREVALAVAELARQRRSRSA